MLTLAHNLFTILMADNKLIALDSKTKVLNKLRLKF